MNSVFISAFLNKYKPREDGKCPVSIRVTHNRNRSYYPIGIAATPKEFDRAMLAKRRTEDENKLYKKIQSFVNRATDAADALPVFTFQQFENIFLSNKGASDSIAFGFENYIKELREDKRVSTAISYECAMNSLEEFKSGMKFADVTPTLLRKYENWMQEQGRSITTTGIYLRSLRTIFNRAAVDKALYPFGTGKNKYSIPKGKNIKKALSLQEIASIFHYQLPKGSTAERAKDYWIFLYLCNGMNVKDFCFLQRRNIDGDILTFYREKTKRSKGQRSPVVVSLKPEAKAVISKWGIPSLDPGAYIFPHMRKGMTADQQYRTVQDLTKLINRYMKEVATELKILKPVTTYFARHSFATVLRNSGASTEFISEALAHSNVNTTKSYLAGFEKEHIHSVTEALTAFKK
jgi:integrase